MNLPEGITTTMPWCVLLKTPLREKRAYAVDATTVKFYWYDSWSREPFHYCSLVTARELERLPALLAVASPAWRRDALEKLPLINGLETLTAFDLWKAGAAREEAAEALWAETDRLLDADDVEAALVEARRVVCKMNTSDRALFRTDATEHRLVRLYPLLREREPAGPCGGDPL